MYWAYREIYKIPSIAVFFYFFVNISIEKLAIFDLLYFDDVICVTEWSWIWVCGVRFFFNFPITQFVPFSKIVKRILAIFRYIWYCNGIRTRWTLTVLWLLGDRSYYCYRCELFKVMNGHQMVFITIRVTCANRLKLAKHIMYSVFYIFNENRTNQSHWSV